MMIMLISFCFFTPLTVFFECPFSHHYDYSTWVGTLKAISNGEAKEPNKRKKKCPHLLVLLRAQLHAKNMKVYFSRFS